MKHLLTIEQFTPDEIMQFFDKAVFYQNAASRPLPHNPNPKTLVNLFCEPSTRTRVSFELAAKRLGMHVVNIATEQSSLQKGESIIDMLATFKAMHCDYVVLRHQQAGIVAEVAQAFSDGPYLINAGDGINAHPTQALLDLFTIYQAKQSFLNLAVAIVGDSQHSRVARSLIAGLNLLGVTDIRLIAPADLLLLNDKHYQLSQSTTSLHTGLEAADVVVVLRVQKERIQAGSQLDFQSYSRLYGVTAGALRVAKPDVILMHPGPVNRDIEISSELIDAPCSRIATQVSNGVAVRMAVLA